MRRPRPARPSFSPPRELLIERLGAEGDGVAAGPIYVPRTLAGERVLAGVAGQWAELSEVLAPSPERVLPPCPHFGPCGGCALQHWEQAPYLDWKVGQVKGLLAREGLTPDFLPAFAAPPGSRRRLALHARQGKKDAARLGYKARRSWDLVPIEVCPIADPRLVAALPMLRKLAAPLFEKPKSAPTLHTTLTETGLDIDITGVEQGLSADARVRLAETAAEADFARVTLGGEIVYGARQPIVRFGRASVVLPAGAFLQAVAAAEEAMAALAVEAVAGAARIADLFCGTGAFALRLAEVGTVLAADASEGGIAALRSAASVPGLKGVMAETRDLFRRPYSAKELKGIEAVVFDPPRAGAADQAREIAASGARVCVGVSCNPATFARDARTLVDGGFRLVRVKPVDQFLWSPHIELVGVFER
jgi:23S rRNA (uracil1939-C5)-methyltransferase